MSEKKARLHFLDEYRGFWIINMIAYHAIWDLVYIYRVDWAWFKSDYALLWERIGASSFIFIAGFCWQMSRKNLKRGMLVYGAGVVVSAVTLLVAPSSRVVFGVLTFLGSAMLLMIPLDLLFRKVNSIIGMIVSLLMFLFMFPVNSGYVGFGTNKIWKLPETLYQNFFTTYLGFKAKGFYSTDYFSVFPWIFMFIMGYFFYQFVFKEGRQTGERIEGCLQLSICKPLGWVGRNSLVIYMLHQPVIYGILYAIDLLWNI